jgi:uncharacterized Zn finger protein (UPF0148 family)
MTDHKCPTCGYVMVENFSYRRINANAEFAIPTGTFSCIRCDDEKMRKAAAAPQPEQEGTTPRERRR